MRAQCPDIVKSHIKWTILSRSFSCMRGAMPKPMTLRGQATYITGKLFRSQGKQLYFFSLPAACEHNAPTSRISNGPFFHALSAACGRNAPANDTSRPSHTHHQAALPRSGIDPKLFEREHLRPQWKAYASQKTLFQARNGGSASSV